MADNIIEGPPVPEELVGGPGIPPHEIIFEFAKRDLGDVFMIDAVTGEQVKFQTIIDESEILSTQLQSLGCKPGIFVGIFSENRREYASIVLAVLKTGATIACFNPLYSIGELEHTVNIVKPFLIFTNSLAWKKLSNMNAKYKSFKYVVHLDETDDKPSSLSFKTMLKRKTTAKYVSPKIRDSDPAFILFSSGSTGLPKGVMLSNESLVYLMKLTRYVRDMMIESDEKRVVLSVIPSFHGYGVLVLLRNFICGETLISMKKFEEELFLSTIQRYKVTTLTVVPAIMAFLAKSPMVDKYDLSSVVAINCGAAPLSVSLEEAIRKKFNLYSINKGYGMTETTIVCTSSVISGDKLKTVGKLAFGMKAKIIDPETGEILGRNKEGEICFKGLLVMKGYYNNPEETKKAIDEDGWLHTGDIGYFDDDDDLFVVDRIKDLIKYKGFQVAPAELEALLMRHSAIKDAAVVGIPDEVAGEIPRAFVVKRSPVSEQEIVDYVSRNVAPHMRLRGGVTFVREIPRNANGKILRKNLRTWTESKL